MRYEWPLPRPGRWGGLWPLLVLGGVLLWPASVPEALAEEGPTRAECSLRLAELESALRATPDDLFLGADYRQLVTVCGGEKRATRFFDDLAKRHPGAVNAWINAGLAYVDRIPPKGDVKQALLGRSATKRFGKALELGPSWLASYTRGFVYLFYPGVFKTRGKAIADLEAAFELQRDQPRRAHHARGYVTLGDAYYWCQDDVEKARRVWLEGLGLFPDDEALLERVSKNGRELHDLIRLTLNADVRVDTSLREMREPEAATLPDIGRPTVAGE